MSCHEGLGLSVIWRSRPLGSAQATLAQLADAAQESLRSGAPVHLDKAT